MDSEPDDEPRRKGGAPDAGVPGAGGPFDDGGPRGGDSSHGPRPGLVGVLWCVVVIVAVLVVGVAFGMLDRR